MYYKIRTMMFPPMLSVEVTKDDPGYRFKIGDEVRWESHGTTKEGEVVCIVPPGELPPVMEELPEFCFISCGFGRPRKDESYMVALSLTGRCRERKLYWPITKWLKKIDNGTL